MANAQETHSRQTRYETLMNLAEGCATYLSQSVPPLAPGYQVQVLGMAVMAQEMRAMTEAIQILIQTIRNMQ